VTARHPHGLSSRQSTPNPWPKETLFVPTTVNRTWVAGTASSVGYAGDAYDNALAETMIGLYKMEVVEQPGPWESVTAVEPETPSWVDWLDNRRLLEPIGNIPPAEFEALCDRRQRVAAQVAGLR
jgi:transposase InsO family protein